MPALTPNTEKTNCMEWFAAIQSRHNTCQYVLYVSCVARCPSGGPDTFQIQINAKAIRPADKEVPIDVDRGEWRNETDWGKKKWLNKSYRIANPFAIASDEPTWTPRIFQSSPESARKGSHVSTENNNRPWMPRHKTWRDGWRDGDAQIATFRQKRLWAQRHQKWRLRGNQDYRI